MQISPLAPRNASLASMAASRRVSAASQGQADCGWYDSSFELAQGLEIAEVDDDALYQLWALARH